MKRKRPVFVKLPPCKHEENPLYLRLTKIVESGVPVAECVLCRSFVSTS